MITDTLIFISVCELSQLKLAVNCNTLYLIKIKTITYAIYDLEIGFIVILDHETVGLHI